MTNFVNDNGVQFDQQQEDDHFANDTIEVDNDDTNEMMIQLKITTGKTKVEIMKGRNIDSQHATNSANTHMHPQPYTF